MKESTQPVKKRIFLAICMSVLLVVSLVPAPALAEAVNDVPAADLQETPEEEPLPAPDTEPPSDPTPELPADPEPDPEPDADLVQEPITPELPSQVLGEDAGKESITDADDDENAIESNETPLAEGAYVVRPASSATRVLDISNGSAVDEANVQLWSSNMTAAQRFKVSFDEKGFYTLVNVGSGKALDVAYGNASAGANVWQYACNDTDAQKWAVSSNGDGTFSVESALAPSMVLDVSSAADWDGVNIQLYTANASAAQRFEFIPAAPEVAGGRTLDDGVYALKNAASGKVLDIESASQSNGARAQMYSANATLAQMFSVQLEPSGFYSIKALCSGMALDADLGNVVPGARVQQWSWCGSLNQQWALAPNSDGSFTLLCAANALALDVQWGSSADSASVQTYTPNGTGAQCWKLEKVKSVISDGIYAIKSRLASHRALDISSSSPYDGAGLQIWESNETPAQRFKVTASGDDGAFTLEPLCSGLLVTARGSSVVQAAPGNADPAAQLWRAIPAVGGGMVFRNEASGLALDVTCALDLNGTAVGVYESNGTAAQSFDVLSADPVGSGCYLLRSGADDRVLDVAYGSRGNGANVQSWFANDTVAQKWVLTSQGGGLFTVVNSGSGKALDVQDFSTASGANVQQWDPAGTSNQLWRVAYVGSGRFSLVSAASGLCLDASGGFDGANVCVRTAEGSLAQSFKLEFANPPRGGVKRADGSWDWYNESGILDRRGAVNRVMATAYSFLGIPYVWDGRYPEDGGMDCSSFTWQVYEPLGIVIGEDTYHQIHDGYQIGSFSEAKPGDIILMYFGSHPNYDPSLPEHVVLYAGDGMIYEEPDFGGHCQYVPLYTKHANYIHIRRIIHD